MNFYFSDACHHNQHFLCKEADKCDCGCHFILKNGGLTPEEFKMRMKKEIELEESV